MQIQSINSVTAKTNFYQVNPSFSSVKYDKQENQPSFQGGFLNKVMNFFRAVKKILKDLVRPLPRPQSQKEFRESRGFDDVP